MVVVTAAFLPPVSLPSLRLVAGVNGKYLQSLMSSVRNPSLPLYQFREVYSCHISMLCRLRFDASTGLCCERVASMTLVWFCAPYRHFASHSSHVAICLLSFASVCQITMSTLILTPVVVFPAVDIGAGWTHSATAVRVTTGWASRGLPHGPYSRTNAFATSCVL